MTALQRGFLCALAGPALLFGACRAQPDLARRVNLDVGALPELKHQLVEGQREEARMDELGRAALRREEARGRIADEVVAGRMGLLEAVAQFHELNRDTPAVVRTLRYQYPGASDEELGCRQVMAWVEPRLGGAPTAEADWVKARLAEELGEYVRREITVQLSQ